jgi:hypothetical protein
MISLYLTKKELELGLLLVSEFLIVNFKSQLWDQGFSYMLGKGIVIDIHLLALSKLLKEPFS